VDAEASVEVQDLKKRYGDLEAVRGVTFDVAPGETFGFLGPNGAGKSTTISMLCTLITPSEGHARVAGYDVAREPLGVRRRIGLVFQDPTLDEYLTAYENLRFHAELYRMPKDRTAERIKVVIEMVGLWHRRDDLVRTFSGGMKRRLEIARGLLHSPRVLFLDEPTVGLDPQTRVNIWDYIQRLRDRERITIFLTTHYMDEAEYCDRIAIIDNGEIVTMDTPNALKAAVGKDRISMRTQDDERTRAELTERFGLEATVTSDGLTFQVPGGEEFVPRLFAELDVPIEAVSIARPTLDDVFMSHTGRTIRDAEASTAERLMTNPMVRARRGR
jgi:ABC-2 type transport system ATP-binding protein